MVNFSTVSVCLVSSCVAFVAAQFLNLYEGDICKQDGDGTLWTCKHHRSCEGLGENIRIGKRPPICELRGPRDPVVCCEPLQKSPPTMGSKSREMCQKYGEYVYYKIPKPMEDGYIKIDTCAAMEPLIVGGMETQPKEFPHMALIGYGSQNSTQWLCGGSLISERYVVSAAHCTDPRKVGPAKWVRLGEHNKNSKLDDDAGVSRPTEYEIVQRINHPEYKTTSVYNDIALYKLNKDVEFNEFIRPTCLQTEHQFAKTYAIATGWGNTAWGGSGSDVLQKVNLTLTSRKECKDSYTDFVGKVLRDGIRDESMMCAGDVKTGKDACQGDSGGPLQIRRVEPYCTYSLVGITSFGYKCGENKPGVFTRVSHFIPWIESIVWP